MSIYGQVEGEDGLTTPAGAASTGPKVTSGLEDLTEDQKKKGAVALGLVVVVIILYIAFGGSDGDPPSTSQTALGNTQTSIVQRIYYAGGSDGVGVRRNYLDSAAVYHPVSNSHTDLPSMSTARESFGMGRLGGLVCAVGGLSCDTTGTALERTHVGCNTSFDSCECLDTASPGAGWSAMPNLGIARTNHAVASVVGTMCAIGGRNAFTFFAMRSVECLSQGATAWEDVASLNRARSDPGAAAVGNVMFVVGGYDGGFLSSVEALDLSIDGGRWEEKAPMPTPRAFHAVASCGHKLFALGGRRPNAVNTLEVYESTTDSWSTAAPMRWARSGLAAANVGNALFALGGRNGSYPDLVSHDVVEAYDIEVGSWSVAEPMGTPRAGFAAVAGTSSIVWGR